MQQLVWQHKTQAETVGFHQNARWLSRFVFRKTLSFLGCCVPSLGHMSLFNKHSRGRGRGSRWRAMMRRWLPLLISLHRLQLSVLNRSQGVMGKCGLFAFGANESSACMCLYQKCSRCGEISFQQSAFSIPESKKMKCSFRDPRGFILTNHQWFVAVTLSLIFYAHRPSSLVSSWSQIILLMLLNTIYYYYWCYCCEISVPGLKNTTSGDKSFMSWFRKWQLTFCSKGNTSNSLLCKICGWAVTQPRSLPSPYSCISEFIQRCVICLAQVKLMSTVLSPRHQNPCSVSSIRPVLTKKKKTVGFCADC